MAPQGGLFGTQQSHEDNSGPLEHSSQTGKDSRFGKQTIQYQPLHGYDSPSSQQPFPSAPLFCQHSPFTMTPSSQPTTSTSQRYPSCGPQWQGYDLHQGGYGGSQMFPPPQIPGKGLSSPGAPRVPPGLPENHLVNWPTSSIPNPPPEPPSSTPRSHSICLPTKWFEPPADTWISAVARILDLPPSPEISYANFEANDEHDNLS